MSSTPPATAAADESRNLARGGLVSFLGAMVSALAGFFITVVLARTLGEAGTGIVLQAIAIFSIALSLARIGMDSTAVWLMPRLAADDAGLVRGALTLMLVSAALVGAVCAGLITLAASLAGEGDSENARRIADVMSAIAWFLPIAAVFLVSLSATRGLGGVVPYAAVGGVGLPIARLGSVALAAGAGGSVVAVTLGWVAPLPVALGCALAVLGVQVVRHERRAASRVAIRVASTATWWPERDLRRRIRGYALPRTVSAGLEQAVLWLAVLLVGFIAGPAAAGIYGGASRFIAAGLVIDTALRIVVAPRFSVLLHTNRVPEVEALYRTAARWLVLFSSPIYLILAIYAPVVLGWLGPGFEEGATALAILCVGAIVTFLAGNIHSVLLMSGRSGWAAFNKAVVVAINIAGNLLLVPSLGIVGAAISWAASMLVDAILAAIEVRRFLGIRMDLAAVGYALMIPLLTIGIPGFFFALVWGQTLMTLLLSVGIGALVFLAWCSLDSRRLQLRDLALFVRSRPRPVGDAPKDGENNAEKLAPE